MTPATAARKPRQIRKLNAMAQAQLILLLLEGTYSCAELAEMTGLHYITVLQYTRELHKAGAAHIASWEKDSRGRDVTKVYRLGRGKDAPRARLSGAERALHYRAKKSMRAMLHASAGPRHSQSSSAAISEARGL